jgi:acetyl esterase/lipase
MPLDPRAQRLLDMLAMSVQSGEPASIDDRRRGLADLTVGVGGEAPDVQRVTKLQVAGPAGAIPLRVYLPAAAENGAVIFLHGGGWVAGGLDTHDGMCRRLANSSGQRVIAVDYRLAPEHPFPAGLQDAVAAIQWVADNSEVLDVDPSRLVVGGDSAGGNLAAAACLLARDGGGPPIALQLLICPILDLGVESASRQAFASGYFLSLETMRRDLADYVNSGCDLGDFRLSPLNAADLARLPPTLIHVAEFDPFRDEGLAYAERLEAAGGVVSSTMHSGMIHYFYAMPGAIPYANKALAEIGTAVRVALAR